MVDRQLNKSSSAASHENIKKKIEEWCANGMLVEAFERVFGEKIRSDGYIDITVYVSDQNMDLVREKIHYNRYIELPKIDTKTCDSESLKCKTCICAACKYKPCNCNLCMHKHFESKLSELYKIYVLDHVIPFEDTSCLSSIIVDAITRSQNTQDKNAQETLSKNEADAIIDIVMSLFSSSEKTSILEAYFNFIQRTTAKVAPDNKNNHDGIDTRIMYDDKSVDIMFIESVPCFICKLPKTSYEDQNVNPNTRMYYRGQAQVNYTLKPQVFRTDSCRKNERAIYQDMMIACPDDLVPLHSHVDRLAMMQHYQVPTRLLDVTRNPLVALFMATRGHNEYAGEVFVFAPEAKYIKYHDSDTVSVLCSLALLKEEDKIALLNAVNDAIEDCCNDCDGHASSCKLRGPKLSNFNNIPVVHRLVHEVSFEKPGFLPEIVPCHLLNTYFVHALKDNARIIRQDGLFILSGLDVKEYLKNYGKGRDETFRLYNIDTIMKIAKNFDNFRFTSKDEDSIKMKKQVLIIPHTCKENIQQELDQISINQQTMMPEISDVAQEIAKKYR